MVPATRERLSIKDTTQSTTNTKTTQGRRPTVKDSNQVKYKLFLDASIDDHAPSYFSDPSLPSTSSGNGSPPPLPSLTPTVMYEFDVYFGPNACRVYEEFLTNGAARQAPLWNRLEKGDPLTDEERRTLFNEPDYGLLLREYRRVVASFLLYFPQSPSVGTKSRSSIVMPDSTKIPLRQSPHILDKPFEEPGRSTVERATVSRHANTSTMPIGKWDTPSPSTIVDPNSISLHDSAPFKERSEQSGPPTTVTRNMVSSAAAVDPSTISVRESVKTQLEKAGSITRSQPLSTRPTEPFLKPMEPSRPNQKWVPARPDEIKRIEKKAPLINNMTERNLESMRMGSDAWNKKNLYVRRREGANRLDGQGTSMQADQHNQLLQPKQQQKQHPTQVRQAQPTQLVVKQPSILRKIVNRPSASQQSVAHQNIVRILNREAPIDGPPAKMARLEQSDVDLARRALENDHSFAPPVNGTYSRMSFTAAKRKYQPNRPVAKVILAPNGANPSNGGGRPTNGTTGRPNGTRMVISDGKVMEASNGMSGRPNGFNPNSTTVRSNGVNTVSSNRSRMVTSNGNVIRQSKGPITVSSRPVNAVRNQSQQGKSTSNQPSTSYSYSHSIPSFDNSMPDEILEPENVPPLGDCPLQTPLPSIRTMFDSPASSSCYYTPSPEDGLNDQYFEQINGDKDHPIVKFG